MYCTWIHVYICIHISNCQFIIAIAYEYRYYYYYYCIYIFYYSAARDKGVTALSKYHPGVYSLTNKDRWSCCGRALRETEGCKQTTGY